MLLLAAGRSVRFGGECPKAYLECAGKSLLVRSLERLVAVGAPGEIILAVHPEDRARFIDPQEPALRRIGLDQVVDGGSSRQESMARALATSDPAFPLVLVHDAARPFFPVEASRLLLRRAAETGAACLAIPAPDTLKRVREDGRIRETLDRSDVWLAQTPQAARRELLLSALEKAKRDGYQGTDDVSLLENLGIDAVVVPGSPTNIKITTPQDIEFATALAAQEDGP